MAGKAAPPEGEFQVREDESFLAMCERHVMEAEAMVSRQKDIIARLEDGDPSSSALSARQLLVAFQVGLDMAYADLEIEHAKAKAHGFCPTSSGVFANRIIAERKPWSCPEGHGQGRLTVPSGA